jgi:hypothetical protein
MSSSVSSERAFSVAGITIGKRRNRLKGDIVEALQCLKCFLHRDLLFRDVATTHELERDLDSEDIIDGDLGNVGTANCARAPLTDDMYAHSHYFLLWHHFLSRLLS